MVDPPKHRRLERIVVARPAAHRAPERRTTGPIVRGPSPSQSESELPKDSHSFDSAARGIVLAALIGTGLWVGIGVAVSSFFFG